MAMIRSRCEDLGCGITIRGGKRFRFASSHHLERRRASGIVLPVRRRYVESKRCEEKHRQFFSLLTEGVLEVSRLFPQRVKRTGAKFWAQKGIDIE